jgi:cytochrome c peroxidase
MRIFIVGLHLLLISSCSQNSPVPHPANRTLHVPESYPLPDSLRNPDDFAKARMALGQKLFFDKRLSADGNLSCASCHKPRFAFGDSTALSRGMGGYDTRRNTPPLFNLFRQNRFFRDGGVARLSEVSLSSMNEAHELNLPIDTLVRRLRNLPYYLLEFERVFNRLPDPFTVTQALMGYQLSLLSASSRYDRFRYLNDSAALSQSAFRGMQLFFSGKTHCKTCHNGPDFTDGLFYKNGLNESGRADTGRARISMDWGDYARFRTPSLRNLSFTAPYMHDGRFNSIMEVLEHYNQNIQERDSTKLSSDLPAAGRALSKTELLDLATFLEHLNDSIFVRTPAEPTQ